MSARKEPPTLQQYASLQFGDEGPAALIALGTQDEWTTNAADQYVAIRIAFVVLRKTDVENEAAVASLGLDRTMEFLRHIIDVRKYHAGIAGLLETAETRMLASITRHAIATGEIA